MIKTRLFFVSWRDFYRQKNMLKGPTVIVNRNVEQTAIRTPDLIHKEIY